MIYSEEEIMGLMNDTQQASPLKAVEEGGSNNTYPIGHPSFWTCGSTGGHHGEDFWC